MLEARLIGGLRLTKPDRSVASPSARKAAAIIGYMLLSGGPVARRERLATLLWSEKSEEQARDSLRQALVTLRSAGLTGDDGCIDITHREVRLRPSTVRTDIDALQALLDGRDLDGAVRLLGGADLLLMSGFDGLDPALDDWLFVERERWSQAIVADLIGCLREGGHSRRALLAGAETVMRLDPYQEDAIRITMENLAEESAPRAALAVFERYQRALEHEYEVDPSEELVAYAERLRTNPSPALVTRVARSASGTPRLPLQAPRIAVMAESRAPSELAHLGEAFRHDLLSTLARFKEWIVLGLPEMAGFVEPDLAFLAESGVDYTLCASLGSDGDVMAEVTLFDCESGDHLLEERFRLGEGRWIAVLNDICCRIGARLQIALSAARLRRVADRSAKHVSAYDLWLEGNHLTSLWRREADDQAQRLFEQALTLDPQLACAYSSLAGILHTRHIACPGWSQVEEDRARALVFARRAVELDRMDSRNHVILGWVHILAQRFDSADFHFQLAVDLNPSNPNVAISAGSGALFSGAHEHAAQMAARAFELNPVPPDWYFAYRAQIAFFADDLHGCIEDALRSQDVLPSIRMWAAAALARLGDPSAARRELDRCRAEVARHWAGLATPDATTIDAYLRKLYSFRHEQDRLRLAGSLEAAAAGRRLRRI